MYRFTPPLHEHSVLHRREKAIEVISNRPPPWDR